jgi:hypothetical protein
VTCDAAQEGQATRRRTTARAAGLLAASSFLLPVVSCTTTTIVEPYYRPADAVLENVYRSPGADFGMYRRLLVTPLEIYYPDNIPPPSAADLDRLRTYFREAFLEAVGGDYRITDSPATDALRVRAQLIDLKIIGAEGRYEPTGRLQTLVAAGQLTLLMDLEDSTTNRVLGRAGDRTEPGEVLASDDEASWHEAQAAAERWAGLFRAWLDRNVSAARIDR